MNKGNRLEIKVADEFFNVFFKKTVRINKPKEINELIEELEAKGIDIRKVIK